MSKIENSEDLTPLSIEAIRLCKSEPSLAVFRKVEENYH